MIHAKQELYYPVSDFGIAPPTLKLVLVLEV